MAYTQTSIAEKIQAAISKHVRPAPLPPAKRPAPAGAVLYRGEVESDSELARR